MPALERLLSIKPHDTLPAALHKQQEALAADEKHLQTLTIHTSQANSILMPNTRLCARPCLEPVLFLFATMPLQPHHKPLSPLQHPQCPQCSVSPCCSLEVVPSQFFSMSPLYMPHYLSIFCLNKHTFSYTSSSFRVLRKDNSRVNASVHLETGQYDQLSIQTKNPIPLSPCIKGNNILFTPTELIRLFSERTLN